MDNIAKDIMLRDYCSVEFVFASSLRLVRSTTAMTTPAFDGHRMAANLSVMPSVQAHMLRDPSRDPKVATIL